MPEYSLPQAADFAQLAMDGLEERVSDGGVRARNCLYLAHLSIELALKAVLERAGMPLDSIRLMNHNLLNLSNSVGSCSFTYSLGQGRGVAIRDVEVIKGGESLRFSQFVEATQRKPFSSYPSELRYGADVYHFDPQMVAQLAGELCTWLSARAATFRLSS